jgi:hypothetical protein
MTAPPHITWRDHLSPRRRFTRMTGIQEWAHAEAERTQPPVCDRPSCYDSPDTTASRIEHGCVPDWRHP